MTTSTPDISLLIRSLERSDDRSQFDCGHDALNHYFQRHAGQNQFRHHLARHVVCVDTTGRILGFASYCAGSIERANYPDTSHLTRYPRYPLPMLRLGRLAVSVHAQGLGIGKRLIKAVLVEALRLKVQAGCVGVLVDAKQDACAFYARYGWQPLIGLEQGQSTEDTTPMWLGISTIGSAASSPL